MILQDRAFLFEPAYLSPPCGFQRRVFLWANSMTSLGMIAIAIGAGAALAFGGGFAIANWRSAAEIERLNSANAVMSAANDQCATEIEAVRASMDALTAASARREKDAARAMHDATTEAARHAAAAKRTRSLPAAPAGQQFEVLAREQVEYVTRRHRHD